MFIEKACKVDAAAKAYIELGETQSLHTRYKCRVRSPWYTVPSVYSTAEALARHAAPDTQSDRSLHDRYGLPYSVESCGRETCRVLYQSAHSVEVGLEGRHYGGGVLELIPSEIERLTAPLPLKVKVDLVELDKAIRSLPTHQVLSRQGKVVLGGLGLSRAKQECVLEGRRKQKDRRHRTSSEPLADEA